jgi:hypothetical protein
MAKRLLLGTWSKRLLDLFAPPDGPDIIPQDIIQEMFDDYFRSARAYDDLPYSIHRGLEGKRFFVSPLNTYGTHSGKQVLVCSIPYEGIEVEGNRYIQWVRDDPGLLMPTDR